MPRLKLQRFRARPPAPSMWAHFVRDYDGRALHYAPETQPPVTMSALFGPIAEGQPMVIDLGCGRGEFIVQQAEERPDEWFVGFDWHRKSIWDAVSRARRAGVDNVRFVRADFRQTLELVPDAVVSEAFMLFPPPTVAYKQRKADPLTETTLRMIHRVLQPVAIFHFVTDHQEYFEIKRALIEESRLFVVETESEALEGGQTRFQQFWEQFDIASRRLACRKL